MHSCEATANNILVFQSEQINNNVAGVAQTAVAIVGNNAKVFDNQIRDSLIFDAVERIGNGHTAERNTISHSDQAAVFVAGDGNVIRGNVIHGTAFGIGRLPDRRGISFQRTLITIRW